MTRRPPQECACGSGHYRFPLYDGHGIFMTYVCDDCEKEKVAKFRPDIFERYQTDEQIEADY